MVVDLDAVGRNLGLVREEARASGKAVRIATKSIRVPALIKHAVDFLGEHCCGLMTFSISEALHLATKHGLDHFLVAYPSSGQASELDALWRLHAELRKDITVMVDSRDHVSMLEDVYRQRTQGSGGTYRGAGCTRGARPLQVCIDVDAALRIPLGCAVLHLGPQRSPLRSLADVQALVRYMQGEVPGVACVGVMLYEGVVAGLPDANPFAPLLNLPKRLIKSLALCAVSKRRAEVAAWLRAEVPGLRFVNGGGSGSLAATSREPAVTEVTVGSGILQSHLFDYYVANRFEPAFCFALAVCRVPEPGRVVTLQSGGFIASGEAGADKQPIPHLPRGLQPLAAEGFGEVQTPLAVGAGDQDARALRIGDPVFVRPAKAGEIAERFDSYLLVRGGTVQERVHTYRGEHQSFY